MVLNFYSQKACKDTDFFSYTQARAQIIFKKCVFLQKKRFFQLSTFNYQLFFVPLHGIL